MAKKQFEISVDVQKLATEICDAENIDIRPANVVYLLVYPNISKTVIAKCIKANNELAFFSDADYLVEISGEVWDALDAESKYTLLHHELLHILPLMDEKTGDYNMSLRDHDIVDFRQIITKYGMDWDARIKAIVSSLYDMTPAEEDKIKYS